MPETAVFVFSYLHFPFTLITELDQYVLCIGEYDGNHDNKLKIQTKLVVFSLIIILTVPKRSVDTNEEM